MKVSNPLKLFIGISSLLLCAASSHTTPHDGGGTTTTTTTTDNGVSPADEDIGVPPSSGIVLGGGSKPTNGLRGRRSPTADLPSSLVAKLESPIEKFTVEERANMMETLSEYLQDSAVKLSDLDLTDYPEYDSLVKSASKTVEEAFKYITDAVHFTRSSIVQQNDQRKESVVSPVGEDDDTALPSDVYVQPHSTTSKKQHHSSSSSDYHYEGRLKNERKEYASNHQRRRASQEQQQHKQQSQFNANKFHSSSNSGHHNIHKMQEAILNGDHHFLNNMLSSLNNRMNYHSTTRTTRNTHNHHGRQNQEASVITKQQQCDRLITCASGMSHYDLFVYYYSDDIDPNTGEIDSDVNHFDEGSFLDKYNTIQTLIRGNKCDELLQEFHRSIEVDNIPNWEGATVSQVCLAEGTTVYVQLNEVVRIILANEDDSAVRVDDASERIQETILKEPLECAQDLFNHLVTDDSEPFPFGGVQEEFVFVENQFCMDSLKNTYPQKFFNNVNSRNECGRKCIKFERTYLVGYTFDTKNNVCNCHYDSRNNFGVKLDPAINGKGTGVPVAYDGRNTNEECYKYIYPRYEDLSQYSFPVDIDLNARDQHGQLINKDQVGFISTSFEEVQNSIEICEAIHNEEEIGEFTYVGREECTDSSGNRYESKEFVVAKSSPPRTDECETRCIEFENLYLVGYSFWFTDSRYYASNLCFCHYDSRNNFKDKLGRPGNGTGVPVRKGNINYGGYTCYKYEKFSVDASRECKPELGRTIQRSLELVFGEKPSPGFICGVKEAVVKNGKSLPGTCCLDAPYQMNGDNWGFSYDCSVPCQNVGPLFSGVSEQACRVNGGTFCPATDCTTLKTCIEQQLSDSETSIRPAYMNYIKSAPTVNDPTDSFECGRAREYFGFQDTFINDQQICDDIKQLKYTRDFEFLNEFFTQGDSGDAGDGGEIDIIDIEAPDVEADKVPDLELDEPSRENSLKAPVQNGKKMRSDIFALKVAESTADYIYDVTNDLECPKDAINGAICAFAKNFVLPKLQLAVYLLKKAHNIYEFTYSEMAEVGNIEPMETHENTMAIYGNMVKTGEYLKERFTELNEYLDEEFDNNNQFIDDNFDITNEAIINLGNSINDLDAKVAKLENDGLTVQIEVIQGTVGGSAELLILSQFRGKRVNGDTIVIEGFDSERKQKYPVVFNQVSLGIGQTLVTFEADDQSNGLYFVELIIEEQDGNVAERSILINLEK